MMQHNGKTGILLINTGSPNEPTVPATRAFLAEFLSDPYVMDMPAPMRWLLLNALILPCRPRRSAEVYRRIWTPAGSPLRVGMEKLKTGLQARLPEAEIVVAVRYGCPSIREGLGALAARGVNRIVVAPLYPQYAAATTGSALSAVYRHAAGRWNVPSLSVLPPFYAAPEFVDAWVAVARPLLDAFRPGHVLLSYHGLPERHIRKGDPSGAHCLKRPDCCDDIGDANRFCYRAQCVATTRAVAERFGWTPDAYTVCFQSRMERRTPWLQPATADTLQQLLDRGVKRVAVLCPSFVVDCLETIEDIGMTARDHFLARGGEAFEWIPSLNDHPVWLDALAAILGRL